MTVVPYLPSHGRRRLSPSPFRLSELGYFTWKEWAGALAAELKAAADRGEPDDGTHYYEHWLATLERLVTRKGLTDAARSCGTKGSMGRRLSSYAAWETCRVEAGFGTGALVTAL